MNLTQILAKNPCKEGLIMYLKSGLQNCDIRKIKEITVEKEFLYYLVWAAKKLKLTITVNTYCGEMHKYEKGVIIEMKSKNISKLYFYESKKLRMIVTHDIDKKGEMLSSSETFEYDDNGNIKKYYDCISGEEIVFDKNEIKHINVCERQLDVKFFGETNE